MSRNLHKTIMDTKIKYLIIANVVVVVAWLGNVGWSKYRKDTAYQRQLNGLGIRQESSGYMSRADFMRRREITKHFAEGNNITDDQTHFLADVIRKSYMKDYGHGANDRFMILWTIESYHGTFSQRQSTTIYKAVLPMAKTKDDNDSLGMDRVNFCSYAVRLKNTEAITAITEMLSDSRKNVRKEATSAIKYLQKLPKQ